MSLGAGFSTVDSLVGIAEYNESDFNLYHPFEPPWFRGGGQKLRLVLTVGTERQDYELTFIEPWFLDRKLQLSFDVYYHDYAFLSPNNLYDEIRLADQGRSGARAWAATFSEAASASRSRTWTYN